MLIELQNVYKIYGEGLESEVRALDGVSLQVDRGEFVAVVGASGSGKSTMMNVLGCLDIPTYGEYYLDGVDVKELTDRQLSHIRNRQIGFIFQGFNLIPTLSAYENVELPLIYQGVRAGEREDRVMDALERVGLADRRGHKPTEMSGGQQQRVGIARAFVSRPAVIFADEPTGNLDSHTTVQVMNAILKLIRENNITFVMVTHERDLAACADRIITLRDGLVLRDEKMEHPQQAYVAPEGQEDAALDDNSWEDGTGKLASPPPLRQEEKKEEKTAEATPPLPGQAQRDETLAQISETIRRAKEKSPAAPSQTNEKTKENSTHE